MRRLRAQLGLDSGYLSRLLRSLEAAGLVTVGPSERDKRVRTARLTRAGLTERALLDRRSDDLARSFLAPLSPARRERLVAAMAEVELLLTAGLVEIKVVDPADRDAEWCLNEYFVEPALSIPLDRHELRPPAGLFLLATVRAKPIGCGALRVHGKQPAEVKRMWVTESARGLGVGRRLLAELESRAVAAGAPAIRLETNDALNEAIGLYRSAGYKEVDAFNSEPYAQHWFEKRLAGHVPRSDR